MRCVGTVTFSGRAGLDGTIAGRVPLPRYGSRPGSSRRSQSSAFHWSLTTPRSETRGRCRRTRRRAANASAKSLRNRERTSAVHARWLAVEDQPSAQRAKGPGPVAIDERATCSTVEVVPSLDRLDATDHRMPIDERTIAPRAEKLRRGHVWGRSRGRDLHAAQERATLRRGDSVCSNMREGSIA